MLRSGLFKDLFKLSSNSIISRDISFKQTIKENNKLASFRTKLVSESKTKQAIERTSSRSTSLTQLLFLAPPPPPPPPPPLKWPPPPPPPPPVSEIDFNDKEEAIALIEVLTIPPILQAPSPLTIIKAFTIAPVL
jgi:hypothetical protein